MHVILGLLFLTAGALLFIEKDASHPVLALLLVLLGSGIILAAIIMQCLFALNMRRTPPLPHRTGTTGTRSPSARDFPR